MQFSRAWLNANYDKKFKTTATKSNENKMCVQKRKFLKFLKNFCIYCFSEKKNYKQKTEQYGMDANIMTR